MTRLLRILSQLSWALGLLSILGAVVVKLGQLDSRANVTGHTLFLVACTFFLCAWQQGKWKGLNHPHSALRFVKNTLLLTVRLDRHLCPALGTAEDKSVP